MNFYLDVEATSPENEIIAIGVVAEDGDTFYSLVKPSFSQLTPYIRDLTHITDADLETAKNIDFVLYELYYWITNKTDFIQADFYSYGEDIEFFKATLPAIQSVVAFECAACIMAKLTNISDDIFSFFHGRISLIKAFNYIKSIQTEQRHNPLEDAQMLMEVVNFTKSNKPLGAHPYMAGGDPTDEFNPPSGIFYCRKGKRGKWVELGSSMEAINWIIENITHAVDPEKVHKGRIMMKMMKAVRTNKPYGEHYFKRVKEEVKE